MSEDEVLSDLLRMLNESGIALEYARKFKQLLGYIFLEFKRMPPLSEHELHELNELELRLRGKVGSKALDRYNALKLRKEKREWLKEALEAMGPNL